MSLTGDLARGKIQTVTGPIEPSNLGITMTHEHLSHRFTASMFAPKDPTKYAYLGSEAFNTENLWWINFHPYSHQDNLKYDDMITKNALSKEMAFYHDNGGAAIVELTQTSLKDLSWLRDLSVTSGVSIVSGTSFYVAPGQHQSVLSLTTESMAEAIKKDLLVGVDGIRCGVIGEVGTCYPLYDFERRSLQATAQVQAELKVPVNIHPARDPKSPFESLRIFLEAGGLAHRTVMSHLERTLFDDESLAEFARLGTYLEFDLFGAECSYYQLSEELEMPSDAVRIKRLKSLAKEGYLDKILISHDIHTKHRLMKFGGHGFSHILLNAIPKMKVFGFTQEQIDQITIKNPRKWLTL